MSRVRTRRPVVAGPEPSLRSAGRPRPNLPVQGRGRAGIPDILALQRAAGNRAVTRLIQRDVMPFEDFQTLVKPGLFERVFSKKRADVVELERLYGEYEEVRSAPEKDRLEKLRALDSWVGSILGNQKTPPEAKLQTALELLRKQTTPELTLLAGRADIEREREAIGKAGIVNDILTPELMLIDDLKDRAGALFEAFMSYGQARFKYRTTGTKPLLEGGTTTACGGFAKGFAQLLQLAGVADARAEQADARNFITNPLSTMNFIDPACSGNLRAAGGGDLAGGPRFFFSQHWWVKSSAGDFDPTAGLAGDLAASVAVEGLTQKGKVYSIGDDDAAIVVRQVGQGETGSLFEVTGALPG